MFGFKKHVCPNCQSGRSVKVNNNMIVEICRRCKKQGYIALHCREPNGKEYWAIGIRPVKE